MTTLDERIEAAARAMWEQRTKGKAMPTWDVLSDRHKRQQMKRVSVYLKAFAPEQFEVAR